MQWLEDSTILTDDEVVRLVRIGVELLGIRTVRLTGGEPLIRPRLLALVARLSALTPRPELALTTNGLALARVATGLVEAGLTRVNISLDTLRRDRFREITGRDRLHDVLAGIDAAIAAGLSPVKLNAVLLRGVNDDEAPDLLDFCLAKGIELRIIEQMPLDPMGAWDRAAMITASEILDSLSGRFSLTPNPAPRGAAPASTWLVDGGPARVGIIASVTAPFCGTCDRTRITADGMVRNCLFARDEDDLLTGMRAGLDDLAVAAQWVAAMAGKKAGHGIDDPSFLQPDRPMSAIGG